jgi:hypothetical protein
MTLTRDGVAGLVCLAGSLLLLALSRGLPQPALVPIGPAFYPRILFTVTALFSAALVVSDLLAGRRPRATAPPGQYRLVVSAFMVFAAYVAALPLVGYRVATVAFLAVLQIVIEPPRSRRGWLLVLVVPIVSTAFSYIVFERYLSVLLPRGRLTGF